MGKGTQVGLEKKKVTIPGISALLLILCWFFFFFFPVCVMDFVRECGLKPFIISRLILDLPGREIPRER